MRFAEMIQALFLNCFFYLEIIVQDDGQAKLASHWAQATPEGKRVILESLRHIAKVPGMMQMPGPQICNLSWHFSQVVSPRPMERRLPATPPQQLVVIARILRDQSCHAIPLVSFTAKPI